MTVINSPRAVISFISTLSDTGSITPSGYASPSKVQSLKEINDITARGEFITVNYSIPCLEGEHTVTWYCSDINDGEYRAVTEAEVEAMYANYNESKAKILDKNKYYKLGIKIGDSEYLSDYIHF